MATTYTAPTPEGGLYFAGSAPIKCTHVAAAPTGGLAFSGAAVVAGHLVVALDGLSAAALPDGWLLTATPTNPAADAWYFWFVDGVFFQRARAPRLRIVGRDPLGVECVAANSADWDYTAFAGSTPPSAWELEFLRPGSGSVDYYLLEYATGKSGGSWTQFARVRDTGAWSYRVRTPRLADLTWYRFRATAYYCGAAGTAVVWPAKFCCRRPDAPGYALTYNAVSGQTTVAAA